MKSARVVLLGCAVVALGACGQTKMMDSMGKVRGLMLEGKYDAALSKLRMSKKDGAFKEQDRVMFWMEEGLLLFHTKQYQKAVDILSKAEQRTKELYTKSISKGVKAAFTSEAASDYGGEDHEKVLLNIFKVFSYLSMNKFSDAMVEARKINEKLMLFDTKYKGKNTYNQDAFAHWLTGMLMEMEGSWDDARISYKKSWETYKNVFSGNYGMHVPQFVGEDFARAAIRSNAQDELEPFKAELGEGAGQTAQEMNSKGEIVLFHLNGEGPSKTDYFITCVFKSVANFRCDGEPGGEFMRKTKITIAPKADVVKVAFPRMIVRRPRHKVATIEAGGVASETQMAYPLSDIAVKSMQDKAGRIFKNAIIRVITKTLASKAAGAVAKKAGGGIFGKIVGTATSAAFQAAEEADKRCWTTLPSEIDIGRIWVAPGKHNVTIKLPSGRRYTVPNVNVAAGKRVFISFRTMP